MADTFKTIKITQATPGGPLKQQLVGAVQTSSGVPDAEKVVLLSSTGTIDPTLIPPTGSVAFGGILSGTNSTATMTVDTGASIVVTGSGIVQATQLWAVVISTTPPTTGQVLTATSATAADWQTPTGGGSVTSVFTRTGAVTAQSGDYSYAQISGTPQLPITKAAVASNFLTSYTSGTGVFTAAQPNFTDLAGSIATGQIPALTVTVSQISATGTPSSSTYLRGDGSWATITSAPGGSSGDIQYNNAGAFGGSAATITAAGSITIPTTQVVSWNGDVGISRYVADVILFGNGVSGDASAIAVANTFQAGFGVAIGVATLQQGDASHSGFVQWRNPSNVPFATMGDDTDYPNLHLHMTGGGFFQFDNGAKFGAALLDNTGSAGTNGQVLSSTGTQTLWISSGDTDSFSGLTSGVNSTATMTVNTGASIIVTGAGIVEATELATDTSPVAINSNHPTHAGMLLISQPGNTSAVWADPLVQGLYPPGTNVTSGPAGAAAFLNPVLIGGSDYAGSPLLHDWKVDSSGLGYVNVTGTVNVAGTVAQNQTQLNGVALGSPSNYGTSPGAVPVQGVNAFVTNTVAVSGTIAVTQSTSPWVVSQTTASNLLTNINASGTALTATGSSLNVNITGGSSSGTQYTGSPAVAAGSLVTTAASGYDGANVRPLLTSTTGQLHVIADSGTVTVAQATASNLNATVVGTSSDNTTNSTAKVPVIAAVANTSAPTWTSGDMVPLSVDTSGNLRTTGGSNPAAGPTGSAVPADASYTGFNSSGNLVGVSSSNPLPVTVTGGGGSSVTLATNATPEFTRVLVNISASGPTTVISGVGGQVIRVYRMTLIIGGATTISFEDTASTVLFPATVVTSGTTMHGEFDTQPKFTVVTGNGFVINILTSVAVTGFIDYTQS